MDPQLPMPSALQSFEQILSHAKRKKIALFLDYDGTLSPIVDDPDCAFMSNSMRSVVKDVAQYFPTSIISGRSRDKVYEFIGLEELHYAGSHGMDIMTVNKEGEKDQTAIFQPACKFLPMIQAVYESFVERTKKIEGAKVEENKFCVSVHYRNAEKDIDAIKQCVDDTLKEYPELKLTYGKKVFEIRPVFDWNKGKALEFLLEKLELSDHENVLPIYVGDDKTDEDAFKVLKERGQGYGILVSSVPKETDAFFSLKDPDEVREFLSRLSKYGKEKQ